MNDHPLGIDKIDGRDPAHDLVASALHNNASSAKSIVDSILDLDELLASDVRLAEKSARFCVRPDLEAKMEELNAELETLVDSQGREKKRIDASMEDTRSATAVAMEINDVEAEYAAAMRTVRVRQMDEDDWTAFQTKWKEALNDNPPYPPAFWEELIVESAVQPTFTVEKLRAFRKKMGHPAFNEIAQAAWAVNISSGVNIPKSLLSSLVLNRTERG